MKEKHIIAFDPGLRCSGLAFFDNGVLKHCAAPQVDSTLRNMNGAERMAREVQKVLFDYPDAGAFGKVGVLFERQQVYESTPNHDDLMQLAYVNGAVGFMLKSLLSHVRFKGVLPREWKRSAPKEVTKTHSESVLTDAEMEVVDEYLSGTKESLRHNAWDAIAMGLVESRRLIF